MTYLLLQLHSSTPYNLIRLAFESRRMAYQYFRTSIVNDFTFKEIETNICMYKFLSTCITFIVSNYKKLQNCKSMMS